MSMTEMIVASVVLVAAVILLVFAAVFHESVKREICRAPNCSGRLRPATDLELAEEAERQGVDPDSFMISVSIHDYSRCTSCGKWHRHGVR